MAPHPPLHTIIDNVMADDAAEQTLARDIVAVHGPELRSSRGRMLVPPLLPVSQCRRNPG
jgi:hypothetical protein